jgi:hypothetical protein
MMLAVACSSDSTSSPEAEPPSTRPAPPAVEVAGPVHGGAGQANEAAQDLASRGYVESEYFFAGTATTYEGEHQADGVWDAEEGAQAEFRSRMIVRRPKDLATFSGTVVVEWFNVSIGRDADPSWGYGAEEIMREGHAWVGVSAQQSSVLALADADPQRYGSLTHPGEEYSFDIYTQAGRALAEGTGTAPLGDLEPKTLIAIGLSQSAAFLSAYINGVQPLVEEFDGFLLHAPSQSARIRTDLDEPVLVFVTESDLTASGLAFVRQADSDTFRRWEVAGASHVDGWLLNEGGGDQFACPGRLNEGPHHQVLRAALHHLVTWARTGEPPPIAPRIEVVAEPGQQAVIERDEHGNALGGVRTPLVDVPIAALSGEPALGNALYCSFGSTTPFDAATLARLYPDHDSYVAAFTASTEAAVDAGFILRPEADEMIAAAVESGIGTGVG